MIMEALQGVVSDFSDGAARSVHGLENAANTSQHRMGFKTVAGAIIDVSGSHCYLDFA